MSYGLAYGLSSYGLAQQLKIRPSEAEALKAKYFATFGKVHDFLESCVSEARKRGYTETMFGRRRYFPALKSTNRAARDAAERAALNAPIQGSAADIMKIAMIRARRALAEAGMKSRIILQYPRRTGGGDRTGGARTGDRSGARRHGERRALGRAAGRVHRRGRGLAARRALIAVPIGCEPPAYGYAGRHLAGLYRDTTRVWLR